MHVPQLFHALLRRPYVEVVEACLPERSAPRLAAKQIALARVVSLALRQQSAGGALLQHLHHGRGSSDFGFSQKKMYVFRHYDVADDDESVALARLFQNREEAVAAASGAQKRQSPVAGAGDKVQVMRAVTAMQTAGHDKPHDTGSIVPALAKNARTGHPQFRNGKGKDGRLGHPPGRGLDKRTLTAWIDTRTSGRQLRLRYWNSGLSCNYTHERHLAKAIGIPA
jgi:hypothetical protein